MKLLLLFDQQLSYSWLAGYVTFIQLLATLKISDWKGAMMKKYGNLQIAMDLR